MVFLVIEIGLKYLLLTEFVSSQLRYLGGHLTAVCWCFRRVVETSTFPKNANSTHGNISDPVIDKDVISELRSPEIHVKSKIA